MKQAASADAARPSEADSLQWRQPVRSLEAGPQPRLQRRSRCVLIRPDGGSVRDQARYILASDSRQLPAKSKAA